MPRWRKWRPRYLIEIQTSVDRAEAQMKKMVDPMVMFDHLYADMPPYLKSQKTAFSRRLRRRSGGRSWLR